jgi:hypothetical protein
MQGYSLNLTWQDEERALGWSMLNGSGTCGLIYAKLPVLADDHFERTKKAEGQEIDKRSRLAN